ncbi:Kinesin-like protein [Klebsormidium nitens]|uniref:Kinesin-like protein n=1 Tax=Klebsormidium nitens TaxID=105231 RepID=A0A1Y1INT9_KLENI|nr:Kinesin-like protein [Klebsormidium nitens]|eukprot:GAQ90841.1 Kinesin-like protein [Klebsormidium nitens]
MPAASNKARGPQWMGVRCAEPDACACACACAWVVQRALEAECLAVLNAGDRPQLLALRGIGARRADAVLALRQAAGGGPVFHCKDDLAAIGLRGKQLTAMFDLRLLKETRASSRRKQGCSLMSQGVSPGS